MMIAKVELDTLYSTPPLDHGSSSPLLKGQQITHSIELLYFVNIVNVLHLFQLKGISTVSNPNLHPNLWYVTKQLF
jgi:hypothetical protein